MLAVGSSSAPTAPPLRLELVARGLEAPVQALAAPGDAERIFVVEQPGRIRVLEGGRLRAEPFADLERVVREGGERGLLGLAFHPRYATNGLLYVDYVDLEGDTVVAELRTNGERVVRGSRRTLFAVDQPYENHKGGGLAFGPDGLLYVALGDGGSAFDPEGRSQDPSSRLGKLVRLDPADPWRRWEIVGLGLRNPWRFSFDPTTGDLYVGDVGQDRWEEIDVVPAGLLGRTLLNFGWDVFEGDARMERKRPGPGRLVRPVHTYAHGDACSVTGGLVYRGDRLPSLRGRYLFGDFCTGELWSFRLARLESEGVRRESPRIPGITSFGLDARGEVLLTSLGGDVYRLVR